MNETRATVSVEEAARILGISRGLAYQMVHQGKMPVLRFGRRMVVPRRAIERLLEEPNTPPASK
jgi:excisionase family DNA binding protein